jgi:hypothetical protein
MEDRIVSGATLAVLSAIFGVYGIGMLIAAYRATDHGVWTQRAVQGGFGLILSSLFADVVTALL